MVVEGWLARSAAARGEHPAVETPVGGASYTELLAAARAGADELARRGAASGTRVALELAPGLPFVVALHACWLIGAIVVPIDLRSSESERALAADGCHVHVRDPLESPQADRPAPAANERAGHDLDAVAAVIHTSGTTARPRAVELTYGNILWSALGSAVALGCEPADRWLCTLPLTHVGGLSILARSAVYATTAIVHERFEADRAVQAVREQHVTLVSVVATTLIRLLDAGLSEPPRLRAALTGGGPVAPELIGRARAAGVPVSLTYGLTEACSQVTTAPVADAESPADVAGRPLFCTRLRIANDGEILVAGPTVASAARAADGWLHTGDLGELDELGRLRIRGRKSELIISGGENVAPAEVEATLEAHPEVSEAAVVGRPDEQWGEAVVAIVVARAGSAPSSEELRAHCLRALAPYKVPKRFELVDGPLPRTASGKLQRGRLR
jgi:O-succinylbenzoic acid--CoA ligase